MPKVDWGEVKRIVKPVRGLFGDLRGIPTTKTYRVPIKILDTDGKYREYDLKAAQNEQEIMSQGWSLRRIYEMTLPRISDKNFAEIFEIVHENSKRLPSLKRTENLLNRHIQRLYRYLQRLTATKKLTAEQVETQIKKAYNVIGYYQQFGDAISAIIRIIETDSKDAEKIADEIQNKAFGQRLKQARGEKGLSIRQLAAEVGLSYVVISNYETGKKSPNLKNLKKLITCLDVDAAWLIGTEH